MIPTITEKKIKEDCAKTRKRIALAKYAETVIRFRCGFCPDELAELEGSEGAFEAARQLIAEGWQEITWCDALDLACPKCAEKAKSEAG